MGLTWWQGNLTGHSLMVVIMAKTKLPMIWIAVADNDHECTPPLAAFLTEKAAKDFEALVTAYQEKHPQHQGAGWPSAEDETPAGVKRWNAFWRKLKKWEKGHPCGEHYHSGVYITSVPLKASYSQTQQLEKQMYDLRLDGKVPL